jgi:hypothetical protein
MLSNGQCCASGNVRDGRCVTETIPLVPTGCPVGAIMLSNGQCCASGNVRDGRCVTPPPVLQPSTDCPPGRISRGKKCGLPAPATEQPRRPVKPPVVNRPSRNITVVNPSRNITVVKPPRSAPVFKPRGR